MKGLRPKCGTGEDASDPSLGFHEWRYKGPEQGFYWFYCIHCLTVTREKKEYRKELEK